ncbi:hypothetical protein D3C72_1764660 [compost metagenome]
MYLPALLHAAIALASSFLTAGLRSSNRWAMMPESRSRPRVSWVRSLEPMEKPSKNSRNSSARMALDGSSHIMITRRPFWPRARPFSASRSTTWLASPRVRTNGTMISTLVRPISLRTRLRARHSSSKQSRNDSLM